MMRANLLPRPKETVAAFGIEIDADYLRQTLVAIAIVIVVALIGIGIENVRLHRFEAVAAEQEAILASRASERDESKSLALDVARYQEIAREEGAVRRSGTAAAVSIAKIGNAIPGHVWLDSIAHDSAGFELAGRSRSVEALSGAILELGSALPGRRAALVNIDNRDRDGDGVRFSARIANAPASVSEQ